MSERDPAAIARGLTKAQRRMVMTTGHGFADHAKGKWHGTNIVTARRLHALGLIEKCDTLAHPTPLGLQVRALLNAAGGGEVGNG